MTNATVTGKITSDTKANVGVAVGGLMIFVVWAVKEFGGIVLTTEAAMGFGSALTWLIQLFVKNEGAVQ